MCADEFGWKKSTTYTVLKKLCEKGLFQNVDGVVTSMISEEEFYTRKSEEFVEETFGGSLPAFLAAFTSRQKLSKKELAEIKKIIDNAKE
jgi:predicted transcriptional regulator